MKRGSNRAWPKGIIEIPSTRVDPRSDPQATQKISREQLEAALGRTKSGTRAATRSTPIFEELEQESAQAAEALLEPPPTASPLTPLTRLDTSLVSPAVRARSKSRSMMQRMRATPRTAFIAGVGVAVFVTLVALLAFFAGRLTGH